MDLSRFDERPVVVAIAGPNGAGKTTFFHAHLQRAALRFVNADLLTDELDLEPYAGAKLADALRRELVHQKESFVFETVFSDPVGDKVSFLEHAVEAGYEVLLCYIGIASAQTSQQRVSMRVSQGGHDVPDHKIRSRYPRTLANLEAAIRRLPHVLVYDNEDMGAPYRLVAAFKQGRPEQQNVPIPAWLEPVVSRLRSG